MKVRILEVNELASISHLMSEEMKNKGCYISLSGTAGNRIKLV